MTEKLLTIIQKFSQNELLEFLQKNAFGEFEDIFSKGDITDGEKFLNLSELQILKWKLPPVTRKKMTSFIQEVKKDPQKYLDRMELNKSSTLNRRMSLRTKTPFKDKLEHIISSKPEIKSPKPAELPERPKINKPPLPTPPEPEPMDEYLDMNIPEENDAEAHYDNHGYLIPVERQVIEKENDYEPSPSERMISHFVNPPRTMSISQRAPLALPRASGDYIHGPQGRVSKIAAILPDSEEEVAYEPVDNEGAYMPINDNGPPSPAPPLKEKPKFLSLSRFPKSYASTASPETEEEVAYEPVDYDARTTTNDAKTPSPTPPMKENQILKLFGTLGFRNKVKKPEQYENATLQTPKRAYSMKNVKPTSRPLPPLPGEDIPKIVPPVIKEPEEEPLEEYENIKSNPSKDVVHSSMDSLNSLYPKTTIKKSQSDNNLENQLGNYGNIDEVKQAVSDTQKKTKLLPLPPPLSLPQFNFDPFRNNTVPAIFKNAQTNLNDEPFFRNTDRKGAKQYLEKLGDGAFLIRPSRNYFVTLTLKYKGEYYHLGVLKSTITNRIRLCTSKTTPPEFPTVAEFIDYYTREFVVFKHDGELIQTLLVKSLPN